MSGGSFGWLWEVDLSARKVARRDVDPTCFQLYLGGSGLGAFLLFGEISPDIDPLSESSPLLVLPGLLTGTPVPTACRTILVGRSPLTGIWAESNAGGFWGAELKACGCDGLVIRGRADSPVYLWITPDGVQIRGASHLWGLDTFETEEQLLKETDRRARVASIGPAGERKAALASVLFEGRMARAAGRCGLGALMGSKNLKAIAVRGKTRPPVHDQQRLKALLKEDIPFIQKHTRGMSRFGTPGGVEAVEAHGDLPIQNWRGGTWREGATAIAGQTNLPRYLERHHSCFKCPIRCSKIIRVDEVGVHSHQPEYETIAGFGSNLLNDHYPTIAKANELCNRYGLDTISTSAAVAFAMECYEKGLIDSSQTDGVELRWGDTRAIIRLVEMIARGQGIGELLADGSLHAAQRLGPRAREYVVDVKGLDVAYHDPRAFTSMAVNYATAARGGCHLEGLTYFLGRGIPLEDMGYTEPPDPHTSEGKARIAYDLQNYLSVYNPLGLCKFLFLGRVGPRMIARWVAAVTGWDVGQQDLLLMGERIFNLKRMINVRLGISRKDDILPPRLLSHPRPEGRAAGVLPHLGRMLHEYYELRGWSEEGIPTDETLRDLSLQWILEDG